MVGLLGRWMLVCATTLSAQSNVGPIRLRVLDGRNGRPVQHEVIRIWYDEQEGTPILVQTDAAGVAEIPAPPGGDAIRLMLEPTQAIDCRKLQAGAPLVAYNLKKIEQAGTVAENRCGSVDTRHAAGELLLFVRDRHWYDSGLNQ